MEKVGSCKSFFDFNSHDIDGKEVNLREICKDKKAILVVNIHSGMGWDSKYDELKEFYDTWSEKGL